MSIADTAIDTFQSAKKTATDTLIKDPALNKIATDFIEAQTVFGKMLANNAFALLGIYNSKMDTIFFPKRSPKTVKSL